MRAATRSRRRRQALAVTALVLLLAACTGSEEPGAGAARYVADLTIAAGGSLHVTEVLAWAGDAEAPAGLVREIPTRVRHDDDHDREYRLRDVNVDQPEGRAGQLRVTTERDHVAVRVDGDRERSGPVTYQLSYVLEDVLSAHDGRAELSWDAIGGWDVPLDSVEVRIHAPGRIVDVWCAVDATGDERCAGTDVDAGGVAHVRHGDLAARQSLTAVATMPADTVEVAEPRLVPLSWTDRAGRALLTLGWAPASVSAGFVLVVVIFAWVSHRRGGRSRTDSGAGGPDPAQPFQPAGDVPPAMAGTLYGAVSDGAKVIATIVDLAVRRHLHISEVTPGTDWTLTRLEPPPEQLAPYERYLLDALFESGPTVRVSQLRDFSTHLTQTVRLLYADASDRGWFSTDPRTARRPWYLAGTAGIVAGAALAVATAVNGLPGAAVLFVGLFAAGIVACIAGRAVHVRTPAGSALDASIDDFVTFLRSASGPDQLPAAEFSRYLPYAMAFGVTREWTRALSHAETAGESLDLYWYASSSSVIRLGDALTEFGRVTLASMLWTSSSPLGSAGRSS